MVDSGEDECALSFPCQRPRWQGNVVEVPPADEILLLTGLAMERWKVLAGELVVTSG